MEKNARALLRSVSRSFYLSLRLLPSPVRGPLSLAYLLARAADTFADSGDRSMAERRRALAAMTAALAGENDGATAIQCGLEMAALNSTGFSDGEASLMRRLGEVIGWYWAVPAAERLLIQGVVATIVDGQTEDVGRSSLATAEELDRYTYQVAGCVGEFWTRLCALKQPGYARVPVDELIRQGIRFGQGLQLINVLRDVATDAAIGRSYLPGVEATATAGEKWTAAGPWIARCRDGLSEARAYAAGIRGVRSRVVIWLPLRLAEETLELIEAAGPAAMATPVKVQRSQVKWLVLEAWALALFS